jgi:hypothetical protein
MRHTEMQGVGIRGSRRPRMGKRPLIGATLARTLDPRNGQGREGRASAHLSLRRNTFTSKPCVLILGSLPLGPRL